MLSYGSHLLATCFCRRFEENLKRQERALDQPGFLRAPHSERLRVVPWSRLQFAATGTDPKTGRTHDPQHVGGLDSHFTRSKRCCSMLS